MLTKNRCVLMLIVFFLLLTVFFIPSVIGAEGVYAATKKGVVKVKTLNVRTGPGTGYKKLGSLKAGKRIVIKGSKKNSANVKWYKITYKSKTGYVCAKYVRLIKREITKPPRESELTEAQFEIWMTEQGFPTSYKVKLRTLQKKHPKWIFKGHQTGLSWGEVLKKESKVGINLVEPSSPDSWKSKAPGAYNSSTKKYTAFDGRWNAASEQIIAYYMDPRNFLTEASIYQFMGHEFDSKSQTKDTIKSMVSRSNCFMNTSAYIRDLYNAGSKAKVNPNVITAMVIMEQGWKGTSGLISGNHKKYPGIYNHFNIGAYTAGGMTAVERGLWWASGMGVNDTSYGRPWNSIVKSLSGGAGYYSQNYIQKKQGTYYTKKFNVMNGLNKVATHQYMSNTLGAESEGKILKYAYEKNDDYPNVFYIPIYKDMPSKACPKP